MVEGSAASRPTFAIRGTSGTSCDVKDGSDVLSKLHRINNGRRSSSFLQGRETPDGITVSSWRSRRLRLVERARAPCQIHSSAPARDRLRLQWRCRGAVPLRGELMAGNSLRRESDDLASRISELGTKSTQLLQFLSFAILGAATLRTEQFPADPTLVCVATWWWILAVFPILLAVLPVKDFRWNG